MVKKLNWIKVPLGEVAQTPFGEFVVHISPECYDLNFTVVGIPTYEWAFESFLFKRFETIASAKQNAEEFWEEKVKKCLK